MNKPVFTTPRLLVRRATPADVDFFTHLWTNPEVMKNVGFPQGLRITREEIANILSEQGPSEFDCRLVVQLQAAGQTIGECKLGSPNEEGIASTDVKLLPEFWGHKYGVEIKRGLVNYLFRHTDCTAVEATPNIHNIASIKMQEAVGGVRVGENVSEFPEAMRDFTTAVHHYIYRVYRSHWQEQQGNSEN